MWKQIFQIQIYNLVSWKLKWNINLKWEIDAIKNQATAIKLLEVI